MNPEETPLSVTLAKLASVQSIPTAHWRKVVGDLVPISAAIQQLGKQNLNEIEVMRRSVESLAALTALNSIAKIGSLLAGNLPMTSQFQGLISYRVDLIGFSKISESIIPFSEHIKLVTEKHKQLKTISKDTYEREKRFHLLEYGLEPPYEEFWLWFIRKHDDTPIWEIVNMGYEDIAEEYGTYIADIRCKRITNHNKYLKNILNGYSEAQSRYHLPELRKTTNELVNTFNNPPTPDEMCKVVQEILAPLGGYNLQGERIMSEADYERLIKYANHLVTTNTLPLNIQVIQQTSISSKHIRFTFYRLHRKLFTTSIIRPSFILFIHALFRQFENSSDSTTRTKFSDPPKSYYQDLGLLEEVI